MNARQLTNFLSSFGIVYGQESVIDQKRFDLLISAATKWSGRQVADMIANCFDQEEGCYVFDYPTLPYIMRMEAVSATLTHSSAIPIQN